jgi:hypothetical protein
VMSITASRPDEMAQPFFDFSSDSPSSCGVFDLGREEVGALAVMGSVEVALYIKIGDTNRI